MRIFQSARLGTRPDFAELRSSRLALAGWLSDSDHHLVSLSVTMVKV